ncbi:hypothetical protein MUP01_02795 [Candidatus Bathyarchaeota archaeon]|nr:hypothetical protein [Candidatus Bathyarchaeota archaeon]
MYDDRRRAKYDIYADIVETVAKKDLCLLTKVSYGANLPVDRAKTFLQLLVSHGFIREVDVGDHKKYKATRRGLEYVETFRRMKKFFAALEEPVIVERPKPSPIALPGRVKTGVPDLDSVLFGGIPENYAVILTSPSCDEKDLLVKRFLHSGISDDQVVFYVTADISKATMLTKEFLLNFYLFVCSPQAGEVFKGSSTVFKLKGLENLTEVNIALDSALRSLNTSPGRHGRVCLDIVSDILLQHHAVNTRRWLSGVIQELKAKEFTTLAVMNPYMHPSEEVQAVLGLFDGELDIYEKGSGEDSAKYLRIRRMLGQTYQENPIVLGKDSLRKQGTS